MPEKKFLKGDSQTLHSEYTMGELDFIRYDKTLNNVDFICSEMNRTSNPSIEIYRALFAELNNLYDDLYPIVTSKALQESIDEKKSATITQKKIWEQNMANGNRPSLQFIWKAIDTINDFKRELYFVKQHLGLGIKVMKKMSTREKIKLGMKGVNYGGMLPEP